MSEAIQEIKALRNKRIKKGGESKEPTNTRRREVHKQAGKEEKEGKDMK